MNHNSATGWTIEHNTIWKNAGAAADDRQPQPASGGNCLAETASTASTPTTRTASPRSPSSTTRSPGTTPTTGRRSARAAAAPAAGSSGTVPARWSRNNWVHDNKSAGLWADTNNTAFTIEGNYISDNDAEGIIYETSYNALIRSNTFIRNGFVKGPKNAGFPAGAVYVSESGSDKRGARAVRRGASRSADNVFTDNWAGVILWENADRFAGSPANTSSGDRHAGQPGRR